MSKDKKYVDRIAFFPKDAPKYGNWMVEGIFMIHVSEHNLTTFLTCFAKAKLHHYFEMHIRPSFGEGRNNCIIFHLRTGIYSDVCKVIPHFLSFLTIHKADITYKEGNYGYDIDIDGNIKRTWELDDGMC